MIKIHITIDNTDGEDSKYEFNFDSKSENSESLVPHLGYACAALSPFFHNTGNEDMADEFLCALKVSSNEEDI